MLAPGLHASGGNDPHFALKIEFSPTRAKHFARARRRQDQEFQGQRRRCFPLAQFADEFRHVIEGHGGMMAARKLLALRQELVEMPAPPGRVGLVAGNVPLGARRVQDGFDPPAKPRSGFGPCLPERLQHAQYGFRVHFIDRQSAQGPGICLKRHAPLRPMLVVAPFGSLRREQRVRALAERWLASLEPPGFAPRFDWIDASRDKLTGFGRFVPCLGRARQPRCPNPFQSPGRQT